MAKRRRWFGGIRRYLWRHWVGLHSLARSFWINGAALNAVTTVAFLVVNDRVRAATLRQIELVSAALVVVMSVIALWQGVGIWRAAARPRTRALARVLARGCVLLSAARPWLGASVVYRTAQDPITAERVEFRVLGKPEEAELSGIFGDGASATLKNGLDTQPSVRVLHVRSGGGLANEGLRLASLVRERHLTVVIDTVCESACTLVLLASNERWARAGASIGFHQGRSLGRGFSNHDEETTGALVAVGAPDDFIERARDTPPNEMWTPSIDELMRSRVLTSVASDDKFVFCPGIKTIEAAKEAIGQTELSAALAVLEPVAYERLLQGYLDSPSAGTTLADFNHHLNETFTAAYRKVICHPPLTLIGEQAEQLAKLTQLFAERHPDRCQKLLAGNLDLSGLSPDDLREYRAFQNKLVIEGAHTPGAPAAPGEDHTALLAVDKALDPAARSALDLFAKKQELPDAQLCRAGIAYYRVISGLAPNLAASMLRPEGCEKSQ